MNKNFTIGNYNINIQFHITNSNKKVLYDIADYMSSQKKLMAIKTARDNFQITLKDAKTIMDGITYMKHVDNSNYERVVLLKNKKAIVKYLRENLNTYERKLNQ